MKYSKYEGKCIRVSDRDGNPFTGVAEVFPSGYGLHAFGREEESIRLGGCQLFAGDIAKVEMLPAYEEAVKAIPPGRYRHFKGNEYEVLYIARHSETEEALVVYRALYGDYGVWVRPAYMWLENVTRDGKTVPRFAKLP